MENQFTQDESAMPAPSRAAVRRRRVWSLVGVLAVSSAAIVATVIASDHQQTVLTELSPRMDITDIYAFPGGDNNTSADRIVLVMTTSSPLTPAQSGAAKFDPNLLYQFKIDNSGDAVEDLVIHVTIDTTPGGNQFINVRGPVAPPSRLQADGSPLPRTGTVTTLLRAAPNVTAAFGQNTTGTGANTDMQVFAGVTDDPFFVDLSQFFRIIPDRRPVSGPLAADSAPATAFRGTPSPPFMGGVPTNFLRGINALAIVIEMNETRLTAGGTAKLGVWGTISR